MRVVRTPLHLFIYGGNTDIKKFKTFMDLVACSAETFFLFLFDTEYARDDGFSQRLEKSKPIKFARIN